MYSECNSPYEKTIDRTESAVKDGVAESVIISPTYLGIPSPCPLQSSLTASVSTRWNRPSACLMADLTANYAPSGTALDGESWGIPSSSPFGHVLILTFGCCVISQDENSAHSCGGWLKVSLIGCTLFPESLLLTLTHVPWSLLLPIKCLHVNPWLGICFCWTKAKTGDKDHEK